LDRIEATFDHPAVVPNAGLLLVATLISRLGLEDLINSVVRLGDREGAAAPGRKLLTLVCAIVAGATHIDHVEPTRRRQAIHEPPRSTTYRRYEPQPTSTGSSHTSRRFTSPTHP